MKEQPILFKTAMVQAILNDTKTETRRDKKLKEINERPNEFFLESFYNGTAIFGLLSGKETYKVIKCPWQVGNTLWVKETWRPCLHNPKSPSEWERGIKYKADGFVANIPKEENDWFDNLTKDGKFTWKSSMFIRRVFARTFLKITDIKLERIQDITPLGARWEGVEKEFDDTVYWYKNYGKTGPSMFKQDPIQSYKSLWDSINGSGSWDANHWIWVLKFDKIKDYENSTLVR